MRCLLGFVFTILFFNGFAQHLTPLNKDAQSFYEAGIYASDSLNVHTSIKPFVCDSVLPGKNILALGKEKRSLIINPILNIAYSLSNQESMNSHLNSAGINISSVFNSNLFFQGYFFANSEALNLENSLWADNTSVVPHFGRFNKGKNYSYPVAGGVLSWNSSKHFNFQIGRHKNFFGDGYRSLLLSDNSNLSNFLKGSVKVWHFQYSILYSWFKDDFSDFGRPGWENKYSSSHYLSWNISKKINIGFFETVVWPGKDSVGTRGFDINYMNPIVFFRPVEFSLGSPDNILMGLAFKYKWLKNNHLYSQFFIDEFKINEIRAGSGWWGNKFGVQMGLRGFVGNLHYLLETNIVRPFTYSHQTSYCNYGSYHQPFAHPMGANFKELVFLTRYIKGKWNFSLKIIRTKYGINENDSINVGQDIYISYNERINEYNNYITQGKLINSTIAEFKAQYYLNLNMKLAIEAGLRFRRLSSDGILNNSSIIFFGIRTAVFERSDS